MWWHSPASICRPARLYMWTTLQSGKVKTVQGSDPKAARGALTEWQSCATHAFLDVSKIFTDELFEASSRSFPSGEKETHFTAAASGSRMESATSPDDMLINLMPAVSSGSAKSCGGHISKSSTLPCVTPWAWSGTFSLSTVLCCTRMKRRCCCHIADVLPACMATPLRASQIVFSINFSPTCEGNVTVAVIPDKCWTSTVMVPESRRGLRERAVGLRMAAHEFPVHQTCKP
mmetsp:Transcript_27585/g.63789  ORF Transcript_27585/g.63789 Transcript_27585/m.63789 type:complete len:232 (-) Transcript_27585:13-708(-)